MPPRAEPEVVPHGQAAEQAPPFGYVGDAEADDLLDGATVEALAVKVNLAGPQPDHAGKRPQECRFAGTVEPYQGDDLVAADGEVDVAEHLHRRVPGGQPADLEHPYVPLRWAKR